MELGAEINPPTEGGGEKYIRQLLVLWSKEARPTWTNLQSTGDRRLFVRVYSSRRVKCDLIQELSGLR